MGDPPSEGEFPGQVSGVKCLGTILGTQGTYILLARLPGQRIDELAKGQKFHIKFHIFFLCSEAPAKRNQVQDSAAMLAKPWSGKVQGAQVAVKLSERQCLGVRAGWGRSGPPRPATENLV